MTWALFRSDGLCVCTEVFFCCSFRFRSYRRRLFLLRGRDEGLIPFFHMRLLTFSEPFVMMLSAFQCIFFGTFVKNQEPRAVWFILGLQSTVCVSGFVLFHDFVVTVTLWYNLELDIKILQHCSFCLGFLWLLWSLCFHMYNKILYISVINVIVIIVGIVFSVWITFGNTAALTVLISPVPDHGGFPMSGGFFSFFLKCVKAFIAEFPPSHG